MNIVANNVASKLFVAFVAVAMLFTLAAPAKAQTTEELQQMINDLLAQVASLQGQVGQGGQSVASGVCPYTWTRSLTMGSTGGDVMKLQQFLNGDAETRIAASGVGSVGMETEYFGALTAAAVSKFQTKYRAEVLSPSGLVNPTGYFGPASMAKANAICASGTPTPSDDDANDDANDDDDSSGDLSGGEASLEDFQGSDGDDTDLEEGQSDAPVAEFEFDVEDGDIEINRVDVAFTGSGDETDPWDTFDEVSLWVDGDKIAEMAADDEDDWNDDDPQAGTHRLRFTGVDQVFREGDTAQIVVGVSVQGSVDIGSDADDWEVFIPVEGIRGRDGAGIDQYTGDTSNSSPTEGVSFDIDDEGGEDELKIQTSAEDPDATVFTVEATTNSDWHTVFAFDLDTDDSVNDITVDTAVVGVQIGSSTYNMAVNDAQLVIDGETYDDFTVADGATTNAKLTFDIDGDLVIEAGDEVTAELQLKFKKLDSINFWEGETVTATTTELGWEAEGADDLAVGTQLTGSATGEDHTLRTEGVVITPGDKETLYIENDDTSTTDNEGRFTIEFDVTAFETDIYVDDTAASGTAGFAGGFGVDYLVTTGGSVAVTDSIDADLSCNCELEGGTRYKVAEGETETFTLTVEFDPSTAGFHKVRLYGVNFATSNGAPTATQLATPPGPFETAAVSI